jgi:Carboxypeptidase regulatory-like domain
VTRVRFALLALPLALLTACGNQIPPAQNYGTIRGRAYDVATNQAVPGVTVSVLTILTTTTGADGTYRLGNIPAGSYGPMGITPPGGYTVQYNPAYSGSIALGETVSVDIPLAKK